MKQKNFPCYSSIKNTHYQKIDNNYCGQINKLTNKVNKVKNEEQIFKDHQLIIEALILEGKKNIPASQKVDITQEMPYFQNAVSLTHHESLNYYLQDDENQLNDFENFLKFKKRTIERDLQEKSVDHHSRKDKLKIKNQQERLFRELYTEKKKSNNPTKQIKVKQNRKNIKQSQEVQTRNQEKNSALERNKKHLLENYLQTLKKLENTNIVKWRILNEQSKVR